MVCFLLTLFQKISLHQYMVEHGVIKQLIH